MTIESILVKMSESVFAIKNKEELSVVKVKLIAMINESKVNDKDKKSMIKSINEQLSVYRLQYYIANALLKYEGLGLAQLAPKKTKTENNDDESTGDVA